MNDGQSDSEAAKHSTAPQRDPGLSYDFYTYIARYQAGHPTFPHETTADQFFSEEQFECYRALGYQIANRVFGSDPAAT